MLLLGHILLLTAGNSQVAGLRVEGEEREVHGARQRQRYPAMKRKGNVFPSLTSTQGAIINEVRTGGCQIADMLGGVAWILNCMSFLKADRVSP